MRWKVKLERFLYVYIGICILIYNKFIHVIRIRALFLDNESPNSTIDLGAECFGLFRAAGFCSS